MKKRRMSVTVPCVADFKVTGDGKASAWAKAAWMPLTRMKGKVPYGTRAKMLYSQTGLYVLVECEDATLTCTRLPDMGDLYNEDVVEFFVWPDEKNPLYFEYEISPLNKELAILVPNRGGTFFGWTPWHYEKERTTRHAVKVTGGTARPGAKVTGWSTEFFIPFALFKGIADTPPKPGTCWRANIFRIDYDDGVAQYAWDPATGCSFHNYKQYGVLTFGK